MKPNPKHLKVFWNKQNILLLSFLFMITASIGVVAAYLTGYDGHVDYTFSRTEVTCQTVNDYNNIAVQNTCQTPVHIRVKVITNYRLKLGNGTYGNLFYADPVLGTDYTITFNLTDWLVGDDGYYYYRYPVAPGATTAQLVTGLSVPPGGTPEGYEFRVEYLAEAIQTTPDGLPAFQAWGATVDGNNNITGATGFVE